MQAIFRLSQVKIYVVPIVLQLDQNREVLVYYVYDIAARMSAYTLFHMGPWSQEPVRIGTCIYGV